MTEAEQRVQSLLKALAEAKRQMHELRTRIVRANGVAFVWRTVPRHPEMGDAREAEVQCGELMQRILGVDGDLSLKTALAELARQVEQPSNPKDRCSGR